MFAFFSGAIGDGEGTFLVCTWLLNMYTHTHTQNHGHSIYLYTVHTYRYTHTGIGNTDQICNMYEYMLHVYTLHGLTGTRFCRKRDEQKMQRKAGGFLQRSRVCTVACFQLTGPSNSRIGQARAVRVIHIESESLTVSWFQFSTCFNVMLRHVCKRCYSRKANAAREYLDKHNLVEFTQLLVQSVSWLNMVKHG